MLILSRGEAGERLGWGTHTVIFFSVTCLECRGVLIEDLGKLEIKALLIRTDKTVDTNPPVIK